MSSKSRKRRARSSIGRERHISVRSVRRDPPDVRKLAKALIALAMAQAEADARAQQQRPSRPATEEDSRDGG